MSETPTTPPAGVPGAEPQPAPYSDPTAPSWTEPVSPPPPPAYPYGAQPEAPTPYGAPASAPDYGAGYPPAPQYPSQDQYQQQYQQGQPGYGQPAYGQTPAGYGYPPPGVSAYAPSQTNGSALALTIVSGLAIVSCFGILHGIVGIIFGIIALTKQSSDPEGSRRVAKTGWIVLGVLVVLSLIITGVWIAIAASQGDFSSTYGSGV
jgi:hypothetical protein